MKDILLISKNLSFSKWYTEEICCISLPRENSFMYIAVSEQGEFWLGLTWLALVWFGFLND